MNANNDINMKNPTNSTTNKELHAITRFEIADFGNSKILRCEIPSTTKMVTVKVFTSDEIKIDCDYIFYGHEVTHWKYGSQFHASACTEHEPIGEIGCIRYLTQLSGIGGVTAEKLWQQYKDKAIVTLREVPKKIHGEVSGISLKTLLAASEELQSKHGTEYVMSRLIELFNGYGFPRDLSARVIKLWGVDAPYKIKEAPYELLKFSGVGFVRCDQLYIKLGHDPAALERQIHCIQHEIRKDCDGHTWFTLPWIQAKLALHIAGTNTRRRDALTQGIKDNVFAVYRSGLKYELPFIALAENAAAENRIAVKIKTILKGNTNWPSVTHNTFLTDHQKEIIATATYCNIGILSGSAGTGKTTTAGQLIYHLVNYAGIDESEIAIVAPTGKASVRITEAMAASGVSLTATTIHSFLGVQSISENYGQAFTFTYNESNPVDKKYIIVDEMSMITLPLMDSLLRALPDNNDVHLLFVGDLAQLPPVGAGAPIRDMIAAGIPHGALTEILRHSGAIVETASKIRNGEGFALPRAFDYSDGKKVNLRIQSTANDDYSQRAVVNTVGEIINEMDFDTAQAKREIQILVAVNKNSKVSREILNQILQARLNGENKCDENETFWIDDKIICLKNQNLPREKKDDGSIFSSFNFDEIFSKKSTNTNNASGAAGTVYTANGEIGYIKKIFPGHYVAEFSGNNLIIPKGENLKQFSLAYAITAHKLQGDSASYVIVCIDNSYNAARVCNRAWLYTAITRATERDYIIGPETTFREFAVNVTHTRRKTFLRELLLE